MSTRPDASMSLLRDLMEDSLDADYRRQGPGTASTRPKSRWSGATLLIGMIIAGVLLATAAAEARSRAPAAADAKSRLVERVEARQKAADELERNVAQLRDEVAKARRDAVMVSSSGRQIADALAGLESVTGVAEAFGPGVEISIDDAETPTSKAPGDVRDGAAPDDGRVVDRDLQLVVNGLWAAGAEAISINGRRLTSLTAIRSAGEAILVDYRPLRPPYVVSAIGDPRRLEARFADGPGGEYLRLLADNFGVRVKTDSRSDLRLPAASGVTLRYASTVDKEKGPS